MIRKYRVMFHHPLVGPRHFAAEMVRMGVPRETVARMIAMAPVVIKQGLRLEEARRYADAVQEAGGRATIEEDGWFDEEPAPPAPKTAPIAMIGDAVMCSRCGFKQRRSERCIKCGFRLQPEGFGEGKDVPGN